jgi:hypothetical protein
MTREKLSWAMTWVAIAALGLLIPAAAIAQQGRTMPVEVVNEDAIPVDVSNEPTVHVGNSPEVPVPVQLVAEAGFERYVLGSSGNFGAGSTRECFAGPQPPAGRQLIVEYISAEASSGNPFGGHSVAVGEGVGAVFLALAFVPAVNLIPTGAGTVNFVAGGPVSGVYIPAGSFPMLCISRQVASGEWELSDAVLIGRIVDVP